MAAVPRASLSRNGPLQARCAEPVLHTSWDAPIVSCRRTRSSGWVTTRAQDADVHLRPPMDAWSPQVGITASSADPPHACDFGHPVADDLGEPGAALVTADDVGRNAGCTLGMASRAWDDLAVADCR